MPLPISVRPPSPGDGSGICEYPETEEERAERKRLEAREAHWDREIAEYRAKYAFPFGINGASRSDVAAFFERVFDGSAEEIDHD